MKNSFITDLWDVEFGVFSFVFFNLFAHLMNIFLFVPLNWLLSYMRIKISSSLYFISWLPDTTDAFITSISFFMMMLSSSTVVTSDSYDLTTSVIFTVFTGSVTITFLLYLLTLILILYLNLSFERLRILLRILFRAFDLSDFYHHYIFLNFYWNQFNVTTFSF